jgi:hypothetical protein
MPLLLELRDDGGRIELRYPPHGVFFVVGAEVMGLLVMHVVLGRQAAFAHVLPLLVGLALVVLVANLVWLYWWQRVEFDRLRDVVRRGPSTIGRVSAITAVERHPGPIGALRLIFQDGSSSSAADVERSWSIIGVPPEHADRLGTQLAQALGVPLR